MIPNQYIYIYIYIYGKIKNVPNHQPVTVPVKHAGSEIPKARAENQKKNWHVGS